MLDFFPPALPRVDILDRKIELKEKKNYKYIILIVLLVVVAGVSIYWVRGGVAQNSTGEVEQKISEIKKARFLATVSGRATIVSKKTQSITAPSSGVILNITAVPGSSVSVGQNLIEIDSSSVIEDLEKARREFSAASAKHSELKITLLDELRSRQNDFAKAKNQQELLGMQFKAEEELFRDGIISRHQLKKTELEFKVAKQEAEFSEIGLSEYKNLHRVRLESATLEMESAKSQVTRRERDLDELRVKSPLPGVVENIDVKVGQAAAKGLQLMTISSNELVAKIEISESDASEIVIGQTVQMRGPNGMIKGVISSISKSSSKGNVEVIAQIESPLPTWIRQNITLDASIVVSDLPDALVAPAPSQGIFGSHRIGVIGEDGSNRDEIVVFGRTALGVVEIKDGNVKPGDKLIFENVY